MSDKRTNRDRARREKWATPPAPLPAESTLSRPALDRLDNEYDLYSRRDVHNERHRRGIAWDDVR